MGLLLAFFRYSLDINLTDEQVNHPLMREAEGIIAGKLQTLLAFVNRSVVYSTTIRPRRASQ